ncbi:shikimate dehydrogenase [Virgibacillus halodenitrificans]|uniref:shikimate dehydrogenase n=1 Tax=Virgibacillus halodenitrificans TaxID=1482 RepID=UPI001EEE60FA|nr:shikimate dehydrogenase [Virgibacillus halodenitrificans]MCG1029985.1 shikimate dehydrogenase [Virgibacillus halodenitrificans]
MEYHLALIGYPIKHSLSPWIHNKFLDKAGLRGSYELHEFDRASSFEENIKLLKRKKYDGFNVTVPYKQEIMPYLDEIDPIADKMGAVNTVVNKHGKWVGYNTDGIGYVRSLEAAYPDVLSNQECQILLIGAGGAARGIYCALRNRGISRIDIANRTQTSASAILDLNGNRGNCAVLSIQEAEKVLKDYDIVIQTTSVGMRPNSKDSIIQVAHIKDKAIFSDIIYQPLKTAFLSQAEAAGAPIHFGHTMLLYQAQYAFEKWTEKRVTLGNMEEELKLLLEGR